MQVILDTIEYGAQIKKTPVVVGNCTGFAVNRVFFPYTQAACMLVDLGLDPYMIDMVILKGFGMPMGPFRYSLSYYIILYYIILCDIISFYILCICCFTCCCTCHSDVCIYGATDAIQ